tara:strand:+ start:409 stop:969 length:561 start_codon:yes stop_codon:yes gene_type:complete
MNIVENTNKETIDPEKKNKKNDECIELKNIKYQTMLINNNTNSIKKSSTNISNLDNFLNQERQKQNVQPWNKLGDGAKLKKISIFIDEYAIKNNVSASDKIKLYKYLKKCMERRKLQRVKDVQYDKEKGKIISIPGLKFNSKSSKFTLKNIDKKGSTLKSLAPKKKIRKRKNKKEKEKETSKSNTK